jgi:hypothetical protein
MFTTVSAAAQLAPTRYLGANGRETVEVEATGPADIDDFTFIKDGDILAAINSQNEVARIHPVGRKRLS